MPPLRAALRSLPGAARTSKGRVVNKRYFRGTGISQAESNRGSRPRNRKVAFIVSAAVGAGIVYLVYPSQVRTEAAPARAEVKLEAPRKTALSSEDNRDLISSQHLQVKKSWENPGVYAWGSNVGRVVAPDSDETIIKKPRRIAYFDGKLIRDIKLDRYFGAAIGENGDLLQWGTGFSPTSQGPTPTLRGKDLVRLTITRDRIVALSSSGIIYSVPASQATAKNESRPNPREHSWFQFWTSGSSPNYRILRPSNLGWGEKVTDISCGLEHCLVLTSAGRVFSCAIGNENFISKGQLGEGEIRNPRDYRQLDEIDGLRHFKIAKIAAGDYHSLLLDRDGRMFSFGDNSFGQLGFEDNTNNLIRTVPTMVPYHYLYKDSNMLGRVTSIAAGGANSFFTVDAGKVTGRNEVDPRGLGSTTVDTWACGQGILGALGNGRWTHVQDTPTKVKAISGLREYDEIKNTVVPIRISRLSVGSTHACAVLDNVTHLGANSLSSKNDTNWGADVLWWGGNEFYQLGTGKRSNVNNPTYIPPLDTEADNGQKGEEQRLQITPRKKISVGGRKVSVEQRIECGRGVTAVYSGT